MRRPASVDAAAGRRRARFAEGRRDRVGDRCRRERVADLVVGPGLREDDATDRAVDEDERSAAVALVDLRPDLEDPTGDLPLP